MNNILSPPMSYPSGMLLLIVIYKSSRLLAYISIYVYIYAVLDVT